MNCPHCAKHIHLQTLQDSAYRGTPEQPFRDDPYEWSGGAFDVAHGFCPACSGLIVLIRRGRDVENVQYQGDCLTDIKSEQVIFPLAIRCRALPAEIPEECRRDYAEAEGVLRISPKASAAISRRLLQHVLRGAFGIEKHSLVQEIEQFISAPGTPSYIADAVDAVRNIGNFAAHPTKSSQTGAVLEVAPGEAEWLLEVLESLFDFAYVQPKRLEQRRQTLNEKLREAGKPEMK